MADLITSLILSLLLVVLVVVWTLPYIRKETVEKRGFLVLKAGITLIVGGFLLSLAVVNKTVDLLLVLRVIGGCVLLYEGTTTVLKICTEMRRTEIRELDM